MIASGILRAISAKHFPAIDARRHAMLDEYEAQGAHDIRMLAAALVRPLASKLEDRDGGLSYLQIYAELVGIPPRRGGNDSEASTKDSMQRWRLLVEPFLGDDAARLHRRFAAIRFSANEIGRRARSGPHRDDRLFVSDLIDLVVGMLERAAVQGNVKADEGTRLSEARDAATCRRGRAATRRRR